MYISNLTIESYRNFKKASVDFHDGINILIGCNNTGKSNLLSALGLIFNSDKKRQLYVEDFYNKIDISELKKASPKIKITATISQSENEDLEGNDLVTISKCLINLDKPYKAKLQYEFFLPGDKEEEYLSKVKKTDNVNEIYKIIKTDYIRYYQYRIWCGEPNNRNKVNMEDLKKFDYQFLDAIRDVERDMFSGKDTLLKDVIDFYLDYDLKTEISDEEKRSKKIEQRKKKFSKDAGALVETLKNRLQLGEKEILNYADQTGAIFDNIEPGFEGDFTESELYSVLKLMIRQKDEKSEYMLPINRNGLGYNNLIYMSLLLSKMQANSDGNYLGNNAKVFPMLIIEEPEAHLHPTMQAKFIKFLEAKLKEKRIKQIFITTHSTFITSTTNIDNLICLSKTGNDISIGYPGKTLLPDSKKYVERFLDATKSNMLFAEKIILVEGMAEQLLFPVLANHENVSLEDEHVAVIDVGGRYFEHFLQMFDLRHDYTINKKVACITDIDPVKKDKNWKTFQKCYPYEKYEDVEYQCNTTLRDKYSDVSNIKVFQQDEEYGKTLEYQLAYENPECELLLTDSIDNKKELENLMNIYKNGEVNDMLDVLRKSDENERIIDAIKWSHFNDDEKKKSIVASRYLNSVTKGVNALELAANLNDNLERNKPDKFSVPQYISHSIKWVCE